MKKPLLGLAALMALQPCILHAEENNGMTGNKLLNLCSAGSSADITGNAFTAMCGGFILGVHDTLLFHSGNLPVVCQRDDVTNRQVVDVVIKYLRENPETRDRDGAILVAQALAKAFPCPAA